MSGGRLTRSKITGGQTVAWKQSKDENSRRSYGGGVYAAGDAVVDSCLIYGNGNATITYGGGVCLDGRAVMSNSTIADNTTDPAYPGAGVCIYSAKARVVNCVMYGNGGTAKAEFGTANLGKYMCCASSVTNESCATWYLMDESAFMGYLVQDFRHNPSSPLTDHGTVLAPYDDPIATDFFGNPRKSGAAYDIGYYEIDQSRISCSALPSTYGYFVGSNITFTASAVGGSGGYLSGSFVRDKDAVTASLIITEMAAWYATQGKTLYDALQGLYEKYGWYGEKTHNLVMPGLDGLKKMAQLMADLREKPPVEIAGVAVKEQKDYKDGSVIDVATGEKTTMELTDSNGNAYTKQ